MHTFILLMASNHEASTHIAEAMERIRLHFPAGIRFSGVHQTEAFVSSPATPPTKDTSSVNPSTTPYLNAICSGNTTFSREEMEQWLKDTETSMGRIRGKAAHGRVHIDLDLVVWDGSTLRPVDAGRPYYQICLNDLR